MGGPSEDLLCFFVFLHAPIETFFVVKKEKKRQKVLLVRLKGQKNAFFRVFSKKSGKKEVKIRRFLGLKEKQGGPVVSGAKKKAFFGGKRFWARNRGKKNELGCQ